MKTVMMILILTLPACSVLRTMEPNSIPIEVEHISHAIQHFDSAGGNAGGEIISAGAKWKLGGFSLEILEGYTPEGLNGRHETFTGRLSYEIPLK